jgi:hypothetical protein
MNAAHLRGVFFRPGSGARLRPALLALLLCSWLAVPGAAAEQPVNFLFADSDELQKISAIIDRPDIAGVQIVYSWKSLETAQDRYDFSRIERDLEFLGSRNKKLFAQIQDRFFERQHRNVPRYLLEDPRYGGGLAPQRDNPGENQPEGVGWVAMQWHPAVRARYQALLKALASRFDGRLFGVNLPESAADVDRNAHGFDCDQYFQGELENARVAAQAFVKTHVVQYVNFWPCEWNDDRGYMSRSFAFATEHGIGLGGPDIVPNRNAHMKNSYPFFNRYRGKLELVAMAVQEPTLTYTNPQTGKPFTREEFITFARDYLGVQIIFWSVSSPWLAEK